MYGHTGFLSGRAGVRRRELGRLKWGVGKLIAHAPVTPVVIPLYHTGMQSVVPLHPISHKVREQLATQQH
jgi:monolysocardiolipin acyltransferase